MAARNTQAELNSGELEQIIRSFRVAELQMLLGYAGRNRTGRKSELLSRALLMVKSGVSTSIQIKIMDLHSSIMKRQPPTVDHSAVYASNATANLAAAAGAGAYPNVHAHTHGYAPGRATHNGNPYVWTASQSQTGGSNHLGNPLVPPPAHQHASSLGGGRGGGAGGHLSGGGLPHGLGVPAVYGGAAAAATSASSRYQDNRWPVQPDVRLVPLPFYETLAELQKPITIIQNSVQTGRDTHSNCFKFYLTPDQADHIARNRDVVDGKIEFSVQVQVRFSLLETTCEQADMFPPCLVMKVNDKPASLPPPIPNNKPNVDPVRPGRPVNITPCIRVSPMFSQTVYCEWKAELTKTYVMSLWLVKKLTSQQLLEAVKRRGVRNSDYTKALIKEKMTADPDLEIATTSLRVSLSCPLVRSRMTYPCRVSSCTHLQCFDASTFLMMNERKAKWICPVCDKPAPFKNLVLDGYFAEVLRNTSSDCTEVYLRQDGSWTPADDLPGEMHARTKPTSSGGAPTGGGGRLASSGSSAADISILEIDVSPGDPPPAKKQCPGPSSVAGVNGATTAAAAAGSDNTADKSIELICLDDSDEDSNDTIPFVPRTPSAATAATATSSAAAAAALLLPPGPGTSGHKLSSAALDPGVRSETGAGTYPSSSVSSTSASSRTVPPPLLHLSNAGSSSSSDLLASMAGALPSQMTYLNSPTGGSANFLDVALSDLEASAGGGRSGGSGGSSSFVPRTPPSASDPTLASAAAAAAASTSASSFLNFYHPPPQSSSNYMDSLFSSLNTNLAGRGSGGGPLNLSAAGGGGGGLTTSTGTTASSFRRTSSPRSSYLAAFGPSASQAGTSSSLTAAGSPEVIALDD